MNVRFSRTLVLALALAAATLPLAVVDAEPFGGCTFDTTTAGHTLAVVYGTVDVACGGSHGLCAVAVQGACVAP